MASGEGSKLSVTEEAPGTVFANTFSDSEDEIEIYSESSVNNTGIEIREMKDLFNSDEVETGLNVREIDKPTAGHPQSEKENMSLDKSENTLEGLHGEPETKQSTSVKEKYSDNLNHGWALYEDDIWCMPLTCNKSVQSLSFKSQQSAQGSKIHNKQQMMKMMKKSKKGEYRLMFISPMAMIARFAKKNGYDLATFMETSEFIGGPMFQLPCMQCYEKNGGKLSGGLDSMLDSIGQGGSSSNGKCLTCGGQVQTLASFGRMIRQMREKIEDKGLVPHDVYPDGNCLFAAIVDQLRVMGDFSFTSHTLRQSATLYLKENPTADDGTPLEMFLTDGETWDMYLARMSEDGEWGDHMILRAIANVIDKKIIIYGGTSGQSETILSPISKGGTDHDEAEELSPRGESTIYLGHVSESHYISLRPKNWREELYKGFGQWRKSKETASEGDKRVCCPVNQLDFILRQAFRMGCIQNYGSDFVDTYYPTLEMLGCKLDMFGSVVCKMVPCKLNNATFGPDISMFFPSAKEEENVYGCYQKPVFTSFSVPDDTEIVTSMTSAKTVDLIAENDVNVIGNLKLIPKVSKIWKDQTVLCAEKSKSVTYLKGFGLDLDIDEGMFSTKDLRLGKAFVLSLAFKCDWPILAEDWPQRNRASGFPDAYTIQAVVDGGCHVISLTSDTKMADVIDDPINFLPSVNDYTWCYTFAAAEKEICRFLSAEQRNTFLVFRALVNVTLKDIPLPSSVVKSVFFYACENVERRRWKSKPGECLLVLLKKLIEGLENHYIRHYFLTKKNLLAFVPVEVIDECYERLECSRRMPIVTLYFLLDQLNVISSEVGAFIERIMENMKEDYQVRTSGVITSTSLLPVFTELMHDLICQDDFQSAWLVLQDFVDEEGGDIQTHGNDLVERLLHDFHDMHIGYIWCFALFIDIKQKTVLTSKVCEGYISVHITEVFGPGCIEELPDTWVPECFSLNKGDLLFAYKVSAILSETVSGRLYIKCMKFYLKSYAALAGDSLVISNSASLVSRSTSKLLYLQDIYVKLFNFCNINGMTEEFREMMPVYTKVAERLRTHTTVTNLVNMWRGLGENKKAEDIGKKMGVSKEGNSFNDLVSSMLNGYELD